MEIIKKLNLNKHPQACDDYSIVCAKNIKLSSDGRNIRNEEGVYNNVAIHNKLVEDFANDYKIVGVIPCNSELVIFVVGSDNEHGAIYRYDEQTDDCYKAYSKFVWEGGEIGGDFTYNVESDLIICFGETNNTSDPYGQLGYGHELRTIKLHRKDDNHLDSDDIDWAKTPLCPEVPYCVCNELNWVEGHAYKGYYEFYIRYKIDDDNYTQWFYINGKPLVDEVNETQIMDIVTPRVTLKDVDNVKDYKNIRFGYSAIVTNNKDLCNLTLELKLKFGRCSTTYSKFQLGYIVTSKTYTKAYRTEDLDKILLGATNLEYKFRVEHKNDIECSVEELTTSYYNYNNVQNIVNYNNRIYIANYIETLKNVTKQDLAALGLNIDSAVSLSYDGYADSDVQVDNNDSRKALTQIIDNKGDKRNTLLYGEVYDFYIHFVDKYGNVTNGIRLENTKDVSNRFEVFENSEGHKLFKVPDSLELTYREEVIVYDEYGNPSKYYRSVTSKNPYLYLTFQISSIPAPYVAAFISYAKFEKRIKLTGIMVHKDTSYTSKFYNGYLVSADAINLNVNKAVLTHIDGNILQNTKLSYNHALAPDEYDDFVNDTRYFIDNLHIIANNILTHQGEDYTITNKFLIAPNSIKDNNVAKEAYIKIESIEENLNLPGNYFPNGLGLYSLIYNRNDLYIGDNKQLCPTSAIVYKTIGSDVACDNKTGYNGFWAWDEFAIYHKNGFMLNTADGTITDIDAQKIYGNEVFNDSTLTDIPVVFYTIRYQWDYPLHIKRIDNLPKYQFRYFDITIRPEEGDSEKVTIKHELITEPKDTIDLFVYPHPNKSEVMSNKYFGEYNPNYPSNIAFNKTVRRSNVIQNESLVNAWRQFPVEGYKLIDENKGDIVKLVAANQLFIVHCEHSIFVFDTSHKLQTIDKDVQLYQPDAFEVDYQELISSDKGFAGLHDRHAAIFDTFGYIFYDRDAQTIYNYSGKQLKTIGAEIQDWLDIWRPTNCRFAVDKFNNRLLVEFNFYSNINADNYYDSLNGQLAGKQTYPNQVTYITLSYSFLTGTFISLHDYHFARGYNTKTKTYLTRLDLSYPKDLVEFYKDDHFGEFHECLPKVSGDTHYWHRVGNIFESVVYIIVNTQYEQIKFLEYIKYRLHKYTNPISRSVNSITTNVRSDGSHKDGGWSGDYLLIFNKDCSTGKIDISTDSLNKFNRYKKPYYELSEWNFNYIRQEISSHSNASPSDLHRRIYGNYFALEFIFTNLDNKPIEFETLSCFFSKLRK